MPLIEWDDRFSVNIKEIDEQHKKWIDMLNALYDAMKQGKGREKLSDILEGLVQYTRIHFTTEERILERNGYPFFDGHKKIHDDMVKEVELLKLRFDSGETMLTIDVLQFLKNWLTDHIMRTDKNYGPFLNSKGIA
jgi:hemerythrin